VKKFQKFYFSSFDFDRENLQAKFSYSFDDVENFIETIDFSCATFETRKDLDEEIINNFLFHLHIALWISYYKLFPTKELVIKSWFLDKDWLSFWEKFYKNGLGEFLYTNKISPKDLFNFSIDSHIKNDREKDFKKKDFVVLDRSLIPLGGGKDSLVSMELFREANLDFETVVFWKMDDIKKEVSKQIDGKNLLIKRQLSENLFRLNEKWYYNGHVPITGIIAFVLLFSAYLYNYKYIVLSNEKSANTGNTFWKDFEINHQYSKSLEFEQDLKKYTEKYISDEIKYFSLLRGMYEVKIAEIFSQKCKKYFKTFSSCNNNFKILRRNGVFSSQQEERIQERDSWKKRSIWCNNCPKCTFVFSILSAFLEKEELENIFWENLFRKKDLEKTFRELLGISGIKPFECVGEVEEVIFSLYKAYKQYKWKEKFYILEIFKNEVLTKIKKEDIKKLEEKFSKIESQDIIPKEIKDKIFNVS